MGAPPLIYRLRNDFQELSRLMDAVEQFGRIHRLDSQAVYSLNLAVEEIITNLILHSGDRGGAQEIEVHLSLEDNELILEISDDARPRNPLRAPAPVPAYAMAGADEEEAAQNFSNLGISLVKEVMDKLEYHPKEHGNLLILRKRLASN